MKQKVMVQVTVMVTLETDTHIKKNAQALAEKFIQECDYEFNTSVKGLTLRTYEIRDSVVTKIEDME